MISLKPSDLPFNTVIEVDDEQYIKQEVDYGYEKPMVIWKPLGCEDCQATYSYAQDYADEALADYRIISVPMLVAEYMNEEFALVTNSEILLGQALVYIKDAEGPVGGLAG